MKVYDGSSASQAADPDPERLKVGVAEYDVTTDGATLTTSGLGSCVGVGLFDQAAGVAGLAHVMLPAADDSRSGNPAKFADSGTSLLVEEVIAAGADTATLEAKIAGGSEMLDFSSEGAGIGERNAATVRETLATHDVPVVAADVGGDHGRSIQLEGTTGDLVVTSANHGTARL